MKIWHSLTGGARFILLLNSVLAVALTLIAFKLIFAPKLTSSSQSANLIRLWMSQYSEAAVTLLDAELEWAEKDTSLIADITSHIFSHPQSFRLAAQPGEYDYDPGTGLYGSVRNDGNSVLLLSAASALNSEILHDIRLSEYLNPVFKSAVSLKPSQLEIGLYTADSLVRSYPWFDVRQKLALGALKKDFRNGDQVFFDRASPEKNPLRKPVWTLSPAQDEDRARALCSVPVESSGVFKGVITTTLSLNKIAEKSLTGIPSQGQVSLILGKDNHILSIHDVPGSTQTSQVEKVIQGLPTKEGGHFAQLGDFYVLSSTSSVLPLKVVLLLRDIQAMKLGLTSPVLVNSQTRPWIMSGILASLMLLLLNCVWMVRNQLRLQGFHSELSRSFSALTELKLDSAFTGRSGDLFDQLNGAVQAVKQHFEVLTAERTLEVQEISQATDSATGLETIPKAFEVLNCFDANQPIQTCLSKLLTLLAEVSQAQRIWFMFHSPGQQLLRASEMGHGLSGEALKNLVIQLKEGSFFAKLLTSPQVFCTNSWIDIGPEAQALSVVSRNILICPLLDEQGVFGLLMLADKLGDFGDLDRNHVTTLQEPISRILKGLLECERLRRIDREQREYCAELKKVVENPLNRIRSEVQTIYSRMGRSTPHYKQHCEAILFEIGRLYEIANEASSMDLDNRQVSDHL
jgi:hypothetical protein